MKMRDMKKKKRQMMTSTGVDRRVTPRLPWRDGLSNLSKLSLLWIFPNGCGLSHPPGPSPPFGEETKVQRHLSRVIQPGKSRVRRYPNSSLPTGPSPETSHCGGHSRAARRDRGCCLGGPWELRDLSTSTFP